MEIGPSQTVNVEPTGSSLRTVSPIKNPHRLRSLTSHNTAQTVFAFPFKPQHRARLSLLTASWRPRCCSLSSLSRPSPCRLSQASPLRPTPRRPAPPPARRPRPCRSWPPSSARPWRSSSATCATEYRSRRQMRSLT
jgi:hypothetical protein